MKSPRLSHPGRCAIESNRAPPQERKHRTCTLSRLVSTFNPRSWPTWPLDSTTCARPSRSRQRLRTASVRPTQSWRRASDRAATTDPATIVEWSIARTHFEQRAHIHETFLKLSCLLTCSNFLRRIELHFEPASKRSNNRTASHRNLTL